MLYINSNKTDHALAIKEFKSNKGYKDNQFSKASNIKGCKLLKN